MVSLLALALVSGCKGRKKKIEDLTGAVGDWQTYVQGKCLEETEEDFKEVVCHKTGYLITFDEMDRIIRDCQLKAESVK